MDVTNYGNLESLRIRPTSARRTIQEVVYQRLSYALMTGQFDPGQVLTISYLSDLFGTSHMPVREALRRLTAESALETTAAGSSTVPLVTRSRLDDLCYARVVVESAAAARAVSNVDAPLLRALEHAITDHAAAGEEGRIATMLQKNQEFHFLIYGAARSEALLQLIEALWMRFGPFLRMLSDHMEQHGGNRAEYTKHHRDIVSAMKQGDADAAARHLAEDIHATQRLLQTLCAPE